jgi:large subunit ribosomal protein L19
MANLLDTVKQELIQVKDFPDFSTGDTITVHYKIKEGEKSRVQFFKGVVMGVKGSGKTRTFTIRKMSGTVGVERVFPVNMPDLEKIEVNKKGKVRQSKIGYFRELTGKKAKVKELRTTKKAEQEEA